MRLNWKLRFGSYKPLLLIHNMDGSLFDAYVQMMAD